MVISKCRGLSGLGIADMPGVGCLMMRSVSLMIRLGSSCKPPVDDDDDGIEDMPDVEGYDEDA